MSDQAIPIRSSGSELPLFMPHEESGEHHCALLLAPHIDAEIPVYVLPPVSAAKTQLRTVEAMAARMVRMIRAVQPVGPYRIAGWCVGGTLAYEIAMQLIGSDETVQFLGLLDPGPPCMSEFIPDNPKDQLIQYCELITGRLKPGTEYAALAEFRAIATVGGFETLLEKCSELSMFPPVLADLTPLGVRQFLTRLSTIRLAKVKYIPQPIPVPVQLFAAEDDKAETNLLRGWSSFLPKNRIQLHRYGGGHHNMLVSPNIERLGRDLSQALQNAPRAPAASPERSYSALFPLRSGRHGRSMPPLFCVPGAGANVTCFVDLVDSLDEGGPVYGLQPRGLDDVLVPHSTVEAAAECYVAAIHEVHPKGPLHLLGHSFGGWVVFEIAQRLIEARRDIASLTILDSEPPDYDSALISEYNNTEAIMLWIEILEQVVEHPLGIKQSDLDSLSEARQRQILHACLVREGMLHRRSLPDVLRGPLRSFATSLRARFEPDKVYFGPVQLVLARGSKTGQDSPRRKQDHVVKLWKRWVPNLVYTEAAGNHMTVLKPPHVSALAHLIAASQKQAIARAESTAFL